jgi:hypothetical protein
MMTHKFSASWQLLGLIILTTIALCISLCFLLLFQFKQETDKMFQEMKTAMVRENDFLNKELKKARAQISSLSLFLPTNYMNENGFLLHRHITFDNITELTNMAIYQFPNGTSVLYTRHSENNHTAFRERNHCCWATSVLLRAYLNSTFHPITPLEVVDVIDVVDPAHKPHYIGPEDPRIFMGPNDKLMITYGGNTRFREKNRERVIWFSPLDNMTQAKEAYYQLQNSWEKNWSFFTHNNTLYVTYLLMPHRVLRVDTETGQCRTAYETTITHLQSWMDVFWHIKEEKIIFHLGTPPIRLQAADGSFYRMAIFHIKVGGFPEQYQNYVYTFADDPPFQILQISRRPVIPPCSAGEKIVFISSLQLLGNQSFGSNEKVLVGYGLGDMKIHAAVTTVDFLRADLQNVENVAEEC